MKGGRGNRATFRVEIWMFIGIAIRKVTELKIKKPDPVFWSQAT
jgi:hypothetical protein